jgi:hypothetical protein
MCLPPLPQGCHARPPAARPAPPRDYCRSKQRPAAPVSAPGLCVWDAYSFPCWRTRMSTCEHRRRRRCGAQRAGGWRWRRLCKGQMAYSFKVAVLIRSYGTSIEVQQLWLASHREAEVQLLKLGFLNHCPLYKTEAASSSRQWQRRPHPLGLQQLRKVPARDHATVLCHTRRGARGAKVDARCVLQPGAEGARELEEPLEDSDRRRELATLEVQASQLAAHERGPAHILGQGAARGRAPGGGVSGRKGAGRRRRGVAGQEHATSCKLAGTNGAATPGALHPAPRHVRRPGAQGRLPAPPPRRPGPQAAEGTRRTRGTRRPQRPRPRPGGAGRACMGYGIQNRGRGAAERGAGGWQP